MGKKEALQAAMACCSTKDLRSFCGGMGVRVRSKEYAAYQTKAGYTELLTQLMQAKSASKRSVVGSALSPIVAKPVERTRKTKNCNFRLLNVLFSEKIAPHLSEMNVEAAPEGTNTGSVGRKSNGFWTRVRSEYVSSKPEYSRVAFQRACFTGYNLSMPVLHSSLKLSEMWGELWEAYNCASIRFSHSTDPNLEFADCCPGRSDVYYLRCWLGVKPNLLPEICAPLPPRCALERDILTISVDKDEKKSGEAVRPVPVDNAARSSRKRLHMSSNLDSKSVEAAKTSIVQNKDAERAFLMQSIRHAVEILMMTHRSDLGCDVEETVRCELQQCTKRLKRIQQE